MLGHEYSLKVEINVLIIDGPPLLLLRLFCRELVLMNAIISDYAPVLSYNM